jgi:hypothetical protein
LRLKERPFTTTAFEAPLPYDLWRFETDKMRDAVILIMALGEWRYILPQTTGGIEMQKARQAAWLFVVPGTVTPR